MVEVVEVVGIIAGSAGVACFVVLIAEAMWRARRVRRKREILNVIQEWEQYRLEDD